MWVKMFSNRIWLIRGWQQTHRDIKIKIKAYLSEVSDWGNNPCVGAQLKLTP